MVEVHRDKRRVLQVEVVVLAAVAVALGVGCGGGDAHKGARGKRTPASKVVASQETYARQCLARLPAAKRRAILSDPRLTSLPRLERAVARGDRCNHALAPVARSRELRRLGFGGAEKARVRKIIARDKRVRRLLGKTHYGVGGVAPWTGPDGKLVGGAAQLDLARPLKGVRAALPDRCQTKAGHEVSVANRVRIIRADKLQVFADLSKSSVAIIRVTPPAKVEPVRGGPKPPCVPPPD